MGQTASLPRLGFFLLAAISLGWGFNWPIMKISLLEIPVWQYRTVSCLIAGASLLALARLGGGPIRLPRRQWAMFLASTFFNVSVWHITIAYGVLLMDSGKAAIIAFTMPVWAALMAVPYLGERLDRRRVAALVLGVGGIGVLLSREMGAVEASPLGAFFVLCAALGWAAGTMVQKKVAWEIGSAALAGWQLLVGSLPFAVIAAIREPLVIHLASPDALLATVYTTFVALVGCYYFWIKVVSLFPAGIAAIGSLMVPAMGLVAGALLLGEELGWRELAALVLVMSALGLVLVQRSAAPQPAEPAE